MNRISGPIRRDTRELALLSAPLPVPPPYEDSVKRWLSASQKESSHQELSMLIP